MKVTEDMKKDLHKIKQQMQEIEAERLNRSQYQNAFNAYLGLKETEAYWDLSSEYFAAYRPSAMADIEAMMRVDQQQTSWNNFMASYTAKSEASKSLAGLVEKPKTEDIVEEVLDEDTRALRKETQKKSGVKV